MTKRLSEKQKEEIVKEFKSGKDIDVLSHKYDCTNITIISEKTEIKIEMIDINAGSLKVLSLKIEKRYFFDKK